MNQFISSLLQPGSFHSLQIALCFLRMAIGIIMFKYGWAKINGGKKVWSKLGLALNNFGIYCWPIFWGFCAAFMEFFGALSLMTGFLLRVFCPFLIFIMIVAIIMHLKKKDPFMVYAQALIFMIVFISVMIIGGDVYSIDSFLCS